MKILIVILLKLKLISCILDEIKTYPNIEFKGMTFVGDRYCPEVPFDSDEAKLSMYRLSQTGANYVGIVVTEYQDLVSSTKIYPIYDNYYYDGYYTYKTESMEGLRKLINYTRKELNMKVMLKPHIDNSKERYSQLIWRANIGNGMGINQVNLWFESYEQMIVKYAKLAEELQVELLSVSCELISMNSYDQNWRKVVKSIREVYKGKLVSSANYGGEEVSKSWWDVLDYIGVDAYYLSNYLNTDIENIDNFYAPILQNLRGLSEKYKKDVIITEIGFCSGYCQRNGSAKNIDQVKFAKMYLNFYDSFAKHSFIKGFFWWAWNSDPYYGGLEDTCLSPQHKFAENVLRLVYEAKNTQTNLVPEKRAKCICTK